MNFICIKTNNLNTQKYLLKNLNNINNIKISFCKFKSYDNILVFYKGKNIDLFFKSISNVISDLIIEIYEPNIMKSFIKNDFSYFDSIEFNEIIEKFKNNRTDIYLENKKILLNIIYSYINSNHKLYLEGFITFRISPYIKKLNQYINTIINEYLIEKEYLQFISLLKEYVDSQNCYTNFVHLIYSNDNPLLLDENKNIIKQNINLANAKYLSDISFSCCDIILNTLLNILPQKIYIHLIDKEADEFIETLKLIFEKRIEICN